MAPVQTTQPSAQPAVQENTAGQKPAEAQPEKPGEPGQPTEGFKIKWWMWVIAGVLVVGIGAGIYFWLK